MERRFRFRLEPVRALREQAEKQAQEALARELAERERCRTQLDQAADRLRRAQAAAASAAGAASGADLCARQAYVERVERQRAQASHGLAAQDVQVEAGRARLQSAAADHKALERLKQRRRAAHRKDAERAADALLSEIALVRHRRAAEARS